MDRNFFLAVGLSFGVLVLWTLYTDRVSPPLQPAAAPEATDIPSGGPPGGGPPSAELPPASTAKLATPMPAAEARPAEERIRVQTDLVDAEFTTWGGALAHWSLRTYDDPSQPGRPPVEITTTDAGGPALTTPLADLGVGDLSHAPFAVEQPDPRTLIFTLDRAGLRIRKTYLLEDDYTFRLRLEIANGSASAVGSSFVTNWPIVHRLSDDFRDLSASAYQDGSLHSYVVSAPKSLLGMGSSAAKEAKTLTGNVEWAGSHTRYFLAAILPDNPRDASARFTPVELGETAQLEVGFGRAELPPGGGLEREYRVYLGPKEPARLDAVGAHLDAAIAKGWIPPLTRFFTWLLTATHKILPNYGVVIILLTIVVRLLLAPLMARQMRSMKRMSVLQPRMKEIQERFADDRQKQSEAMMALYKEAGVNPLSMMTGCLPMFLQMPVFIGFYYALQGAIQLRQQPFIGWIDDLSQPEALFVLPGIDLPVRLLPILMGLSMVAQQKLTPSTMDPAQARVMLTVMPVMFTLMFYQFASGLVLYWLVSTLLGIGQQMLTNRTKTQ